MKKQTLKAIGGAALAILMLVIVAQLSVSAQGGHKEALKGEGGGDNTLVGSWNLQVTLRDCPSGTPFITFPAMMTYAHGGTTQQTAPPEPGATFLPGHGTWSHQAKSTYTGAFQFFILNPDGSVQRKTIVRSAITLSKDGDSYTSTDSAQIFDASGNLLYTACSTTSATRFK